VARCHFRNPSTNICLVVARGEAVTPLHRHSDRARQTEFV